MGGQELGSLERAALKGWSEEGGIYGIITVCYPALLHRIGEKLQSYIGPRSRGLCILL